MSHKEQNIDLGYLLILEYADDGILRNNLENNFNKLDWNIKSLQFVMSLQGFGIELCVSWIGLAKYLDDYKNANIYCTLFLVTCAFRVRLRSRLRQIFREYVEKNRNNTISPTIETLYTRICIATRVMLSDIHWASSILIVRIFDGFQVDIIG